MADATLVAHSHLHRATTDVHRHSIRWEHESVTCVEQGARVYTAVAVILPIGAEPHNQR